MADILPYLGVERIYTEEEMEHADVSTPNVMDYSLTQARSSLQRVGFEIKVIGDGTRVTNQYPVGGQAVTRGSVIVLYTNDEPVKEVTVPDLTGKTVKQVRNILLELDLNVRVEGSASDTATAITQSYEAGETVNAGTVITVTFIDSSLND